VIVRPFPFGGNGVLSYADLAYDLAGAADIYHWPLDETSWNGTAGEITDVKGNSDGTYDNWSDIVVNSGQDPVVGPQIGTLPGLSSGFRDNTARFVAGYGQGGIDSFDLGNYNWAGGAATVMGWCMVVNPEDGAPTATGVNLFASPTHSSWELSQRTNVNPNEMYVDSTSVTTWTAVDGVPVFYAHTTADQEYVYYSGALQKQHFSAWTGPLGSGYLQCHAFIGWHATNLSSIYYKDVMFFDGTALTQSELLSLYLAGTT
jgi:hypothetical protein